MVLTPFSNYITKIFEAFFSPQESYRSDLDKFIIENNPQSNADVEMLTRQFDRRAQGKTSWIE
jgi:hypothetical protein